MDSLDQGTRVKKSVTIIINDLAKRENIIVYCNCRKSLIMRDHFKKLVQSSLKSHSFKATLYNIKPSELHV